MEILHINSNFIYTKIYENLLDHLDSEFNNTIYMPRKENDFKFHSKYKIIKPEIINRSDSIFTKHRLKKTFHYLVNKVDVSEINLIHAYSITNDGVLAYKIFREYGIEYILNIRNTDINFTFKYKKYNKKLYEQVVKSAKVIVFPNNQYKQKMLHFFSNNQLVCSKIDSGLVIPNGIDNFWLENFKKEKKEIAANRNINILYIGRVYKQKNIHNIVNALDILNNNSNYKFNLNIVGKIIDEKYFKTFKTNSAVNYLGEKDKKTLKKTMEYNHIFAMPSLGETFGLVYIESLSQNLPIIYTKNEGIDGFFENGKYGLSVNPTEPEDIANKIMDVIVNYSLIQENLVDKNILKHFDWKSIGEKYSLIYKGKY